MVKRLTTKQAAEMLGCELTTIRRWVDLGYLTPWTASGDRRQGQRMQFDPGEIEAFRDGSAPGAEAYRRQKQLGRSTPKRRGRKCKT